MFKLLGLKWKKEFESLKCLHDIEMAKKESALKIQAEELTKRHELALTEATTLLKLDYQQQIKQKEMDFQKTVNDLKASQLMEQANFKAKVQDENYERLKDAMTKLHEEGNVTTKFTQDLALKMFEKVPTAKSEHTYLSGDVAVQVDK
jgi:hypothetical protein